MGSHTYDKSGTIKAKRRFGKRRYIIFNEVNSMSDMVREWYETKENVDEMNLWENPKLKR